MGSASSWHRRAQFRRQWVVVDAIDDNAVSFYEKHGFEGVPDHPRRLVQKLVNVAAALELDWP